MQVNTDDEDGEDGDDGDAEGEVDERNGDINERDQVWWPAAQCAVYYSSWSVNVADKGTTFLIETLDKDSGGAS